MCCKFCYKIGEIKKEIYWGVRSCLAEQNVEDYNELPSEWDGKHRQIEMEGFYLSIYKSNDNVSVSVEYRVETDDGLIIHPFSNAIRWSFCPFCGEQISKDIQLAENIYSDQFDIEDEQEYELKDYL